VPIVDLVVLSTNLPHGGARSPLEGIKLDPTTVDTAVLCLVAGDPTASEIGRLSELGAEAVIERSENVDEIAYRVQSRLYPQHRDRRAARLGARPGRLHGAPRDLPGRRARHQRHWRLRAHRLPPRARHRRAPRLLAAARRAAHPLRVARVVVGGEPGAARPSGSGIGLVFTSMEPADSRLIPSFVEQSLYSDPGAGAERVLPLDALMR
jgi:hypothetical protein